MKKNKKEKETFKDDERKNKSREGFKWKAVLLQY